MFEKCLCLKSQLKTNGKGRIEINRKEETFLKLKSQCPSREERRLGITGVVCRKHLKNNSEDL
jgi:hypothetical protein